MIVNMTVLKRSVWENVIRLAPELAGEDSLDFRIRIQARHAHAEFREQWNLLEGLLRLDRRFGEESYLDTDTVRSTLIRAKEAARDRLKERCISDPFFQMLIQCNFDLYILEQIEFRAGSHP